MKLKGLKDECFNDYKKIAMLLIFPYCNFKCDIENKRALCQNSALAQEPNISISKEELIERYLANPLTGAIVCGGLEPFDSEIDLLSFIECLRRQYYCDDPVVIYTGYTESEIATGHWGHGSPEAQRVYWHELKSLGNIIIKYGRFRPDEEKHFDEILGVNLASSNQYAKEYK